MSNRYLARVIFVPVRIVHCRSVKFAALIYRMFATCRHGSVVAVAIVQSVIDMTVEVPRPVEPGAGPNEHTTREPFRTVVPIRRAVVRRNFVVTVGANRWCANFYRNLSWRTRTRSEEQAHNNGQHCYKLQSSHCFTSIHLRSRAATRVVQCIRHASEIKVNSVRYRTHLRFYRKRFCSGGPIQKPFKNWRQSRNAGV